MDLDPVRYQLLYFLLHKFLSFLIFNFLTSFNYISSHINFYHF